MTEVVTQKKRTSNFDITEEWLSGFDIKDGRVFTIGETSALCCGVKPHVLRYWESEFKMKPHRSNSGQRLYRRTELTLFMKIKRLVYDEGYTISGARRSMEGVAEGQPVIQPQQVKTAISQLERIKEQLSQLREEILNPIDI